MDYNNLAQELSKAIKESLGKESRYIERDIANFPQLRWLYNYMVGHNGYIAGGCFKNIINGEKVKDIDIFFENETEQVKAKMYYQENKDYIKAYNNDRVDAFKNIKTDVVVELVKTKFDKPKDMLKTFDFTITKMAVFTEKIPVEGKDDEIVNHKIIYHKDFFEDLVMKRIIIDCKELNMPLGTFNRALRYTKYGYTMCRNSKLFLVNEILKTAKKKNIEEFSLDDFSRELYDSLD